MDLPPTPAAPETITAAAELGVDLSAHRSTPIGRADVADADLVLGFEQQHITTAVVDYEVPIEHCFLITELAGLLPQPDESLEGRDAIAAAAASRRSAGSFRLPPQIQDPIGRPRQVHRRVLREIAHHCDSIFTSLVSHARP